MGSTILNIYLENWWGSEWETGKLAAFPVWKLEDGEDPGHVRHLKLRGACSTKVNAVLFPLPEASEQTCPTFGMYVRPVAGFWSTGTHLRRKEVWDYTVSAIRLLPVLCRCSAVLCIVLPEDSQLWCQCAPHLRRREPGQPLTWIKRSEEDGFFKVCVCARASTHVFSETSFHLTVYPPGLVLAVKLRLTSTS